jgi:hypothetical protein
MSKQISFNKNYFEVIKDLTKIQQAIKFSKKDDKISVIMPSDSKSIAFILNAPSTYFDFEGNEVNFRFFAEFYQFINAFESVSLMQTDNSFKITNQNSEINYIISNPQVMPKIPTGINKKDPSITFILTINALNDMVKMTNMVKAESINIKFDGTNIFMKSFNSINNHNFKKTFTPEVITDKEPFDFTIKAEVINKMPVVADYRISLVKNGFIFLEWNKDNMDFMAVSGRIRKEEKPKDENVSF